MTRLEALMTEIPIIAILRGVTPSEVIAVGEVIIQAGIRLIEVPMNSPEPFESIRRLSEAYPHIITGGGTVINPDDVHRIKDAGGTIIVSPNMNPRVIRRALDLSMVPMPGIQTATEAFAAYDLGVRYLKLFPAGALGPAYVKALKAVLPSDAKMLAVGGARASHFATWMQAGTDGFGIGSELFKPGKTLADIADSAALFVSSYTAARTAQTI
jgi:2-dehydro-3-deoxyphosphogalactonate aldolase